MSITSIPRIAIQKAGSLIGLQRTLNFIEGSNVTLTVQDDPANRRVNCTIASSGGGGVTGQLARVAGQYLCPPVFATSANTYVSALANRLYLIPLIVPSAITFDRISIHVGSTSSTGSARLGLYNTDSAGVPTTVAFDAGTVSTATGGLKEITISEAISAGEYFFAFIADENFSPLGRSSNSSLLRAVAGDATSDQSCSLYRSGPYGALPDVTGQTFTAWNACHAMWGRLA